MRNHFAGWLSDRCDQRGCWRRSRYVCFKGDERTQWCKRHLPSEYRDVRGRARGALMNRSPATKQRSQWYRAEAPVQWDELAREAGLPATRPALWMRNVHDGTLRVIVNEEPLGWHLSISHVYRRGGYTPAGTVRRELMGIDWMTQNELTQAIPPAYTELIGRQLMQALGRETGGGR